MIRVPPVVREKALAAGAGDWLQALPLLVSGLERDWGIRVGRALSGGTESFVAEATCADGSPAVLKLMLPRGGEEHELTALRLAGGWGCAELFRSDAERGALLLERLGRPLSELGLPTRRRQEILVETAKQLWRPVPRSGLPTGATKARELARSIVALWEELERPCSRRVVDHAVACAGRRAEAHRDEATVLVHGDVHQWNALEATDGFKLVDPDGLLAEPEYDLGILMREDPSEDDLLERSTRLARATGLNEEAIWEWGVVERVSTGLLATRVGLQPAGADMLAAAKRILRSRRRSGPEWTTSSSRHPSA